MNLGMLWLCEGSSIAKNVEQAKAVYDLKYGDKHGPANRAYAHAKDLPTDTVIGDVFVSPVAKGILRGHIWIGYDKGQANRSNDAQID